MVSHSVQLSTMLVACHKTGHWEPARDWWHLTARTLRRQLCSQLHVLHAAGQESDYVNTLTNLFKDIALAIDENQGFVEEAFGREAVLTLISGLQQVAIMWKVV